MFTDSQTEKKNRFCNGKRAVMVVWTVNQIRKFDIGLYAPHLLFFVQ